MKNRRNGKGEKLNHSYLASQLQQKIKAPMTSEKGTAVDPLKDSRCLCDQDKDKAIMQICVLSRASFI